MYKKDNPTFVKSIDAMVPAYDNRGNNTCKILCSKGRSTSLPMSMPQFIRSWFQFLRIDLYAQRMWSQEILGQRNLNPLVINEHAIFIPVKLREPIGEKDGSYGYIRASSIQDVTPDHIVLSSGAEIPYLSATETIKKKIQHARLLKYTYIEELKLQRMIYRKEKEDFQEDLED